MSSTLLIVDDHALTRRNVRFLLDKHLTIDVCGEAKDGEDALKQVGELRPDIVLLDISMPRMNGLQAAQEIHRILPSTTILFFTAHPESLFKYSRWSSNGLVSKLDVETQLIPTLDRLLQNQSEQLHGSIRYEWQRYVVDAFASAAESLPLKMGLAQHAIAARLTDVKAPDHDEQTALKEALQVLRQLRTRASNVNNEVETKS